MEIKIGRKTVGENNQVFVVAELSGNHHQDFDLAVKTIKAMKVAGADAVKIQTYTPDTITLNCDADCFQIKQGTIWDGTTLYKLYQKAYTPWEWQPKLKKVAEGLGLIFFSSPFDESAVDFLEKLDVPAYKIASFEIVDIPLIEYAASKGKPMFISTGVATKNDIDEAVQACKRMNNNQIILLKCVSAYPAPLEDINLLTMTDMKKRYKTVVGLSDHSLGLTVPIVAVSLGACIVEKHFILDRSIGGPDASFSLESNEFAQMVREIREVEKTLGKVTYQLTDMMKRARTFSPSLFVVEKVNKGDTFTKNNLKSIRPGFGIAPKFLKNVLGKKAKKGIERGTPLSWKLVDTK